MIMPCMKSTSACDRGGNVPLVEGGNFLLGWPGGPGCTTAGVLAPVCCARATEKNNPAEVHAANSMPHSTANPRAERALRSLRMPRTFDSRGYSNISNRLTRKTTPSIRPFCPISFSTTAVLRSVIEGWPADSLSIQMKTYVHMIRNFDEWDSLVHPVVLAVEHHGSFDRAGILALARHCERQLLWVGYSAYVEVAIHFIGVRCDLHELRRFEGDDRIVLHVKKILALQLAILHSAAGIHARGLYGDGQDSGRFFRRRERQGRIPFVKFPGQRHRGLHVKFNRAAFLCDLVNRSLRLSHRGQQNRSQPENNRKSHGAQCLYFPFHCQCACRNQLHSTARAVGCGACARDPNAINLRVARV